MLGRLLLILLQLVLGWYVSLEIAFNIPSLGNLDIFLMAALFAFIVWLIGLLSAAVFKELTKPTPGALLFAFGVAVLFASLTIFPEVQQLVTSVAGKLDLRLYPLIGAVIGYAVQS